MGEGRFELADTHDVFEIAILYEYDRERGVHDIDIRYVGADTRHKRKIVEMWAREILGAPSATPLDKDTYDIGFLLDVRGPGLSPHPVGEMVSATIKELRLKWPDTKKTAVLRKPGGNILDDVRAEIAKGLYTRDEVCVAGVVLDVCYYDEYGDEAREEITISPNRSNYLSKSPHVQKIVRKFFKHHGILPNDSEEVRRGA